MTNEQKYKTAEERQEAFSRFCDQYKSRNVCHACPCWQVGKKWHINCRFLWLDLEAEKEKPLPCPFCGGEAEVPISMSKAEYVRCKKCRALSMPCNTKAEAIAAWNRRVK